MMSICDFIDLHVQKCVVVFSFLKSLFHSLHSSAEQLIAEISIRSYEFGSNISKNINIAIDNH